MSVPSGLRLMVLLMVGLPWPAYAHPGVPNDLSSQLRHVMTHPDHVGPLVLGLGVLALGLGIVILRSRAEARRGWSNRMRRDR
jgi:hydrogenase/urease accessory protein HupE